LFLLFYDNGFNFFQLDYVKRNTASCLPRKTKLQQLSGLANQKPVADFRMPENQIGKTAVAVALVTIFYPTSPTACAEQLKATQSVWQGNRKPLSHN